MFTVRKIAIVTSLFPPSDHNVAVYSYYLAKELTGMGIKVKVITSWKNEACGTKAIDGVPVACIPAKKLFNRFFFISGKYYKDVAREIEEFAPDLVAVNDYVERLSLFGAKAAAALEIPCLAINHLTAPVSHRIKPLDWAYKRYERKMLHLFKKHRAVFAGASGPQTEHLKKMGAMPRYEIPYGIEADMLPLPAAKSKLGVGEGAILCVMEGDDAKEMQKILGALRGVKEFNGPEITLVVTGKKKKDMPDACEGVFYTGEIPQEEKISLKYGCDIYIHFAKRDSFGFGLLEAGLMSCAVLCVLPEEEFGFDTVKNLDTGLVVSGGEDEIMAALQKLRLHTKLRRELAGRLKCDIELKHGWNQGALALVDAAWALNGGRRLSSK